MDVVIHKIKNEDYNLAILQFGNLVLLIMYFLIIIKLLLEVAKLYSFYKSHGLDSINPYSSESHK